jgi:hypothetical protein
MFDNPEALAEKIEAYFDQFRPAKEGEDKVNPEYNEWRPSITGLCLFCGFESRQSFYAYEQKEGFSYTIKRARVRIENVYEQFLTTKTSTGAIFALKNFDWTDKQEIDQKTTLTDQRIDESKLTDEELRVLAEIQRKGGVI